MRSCQRPTEGYERNPGRLHAPLMANRLDVQDNHRFFHIINGRLFPTLVSPWQWSSELMDYPVFMTTFGQSGSHSSSTWVRFFFTGDERSEISRTTPVVFIAFSAFRLIAVSV